jgi:hypothetical protein
MDPKRFSVGRESGEDALRALHIYIAGFGINRGRARRVTEINRVAEKIVEAVAPKFLAGFGVKAGHAFLEIGAFGGAIADDVKFAVGDDGGGLAGEGSGPERLGGVDGVGQTFFVGDAALIRAAPGQPAVNRSERRKSRARKCAREEQRLANIHVTSVVRAPRQPQKSDWTK